MNNEKFTMPRKLAAELLGALFNGPTLNPQGYEALKQDFAARLRALPENETATPFMFAIKGPDGAAHIDENCVSATEDGLHSEVNGLNDSPDTGYSIVPVYLGAQIDERVTDYHWSKGSVEMSQFLTDVTTAAGLLSHGRQDKALAARLGLAAFSMRIAPVPAADVQGDALRDAVRQMTMALKNREWADLLCADDDAAALEIEIGEALKRVQPDSGRDAALVESDPEQVARAKWTVKQWYEHVGAWENAQGEVCFGSVMALGAMLKLMAKARASRPVQQPAAVGDKSTFLNWVADRLVHVYGESPNIDFVLALRRIASAAIPAAGVQGDGPMYAAMSAKAAPELHAQVMAQIDDVITPDSGRDAALGADTAWAEWSSNWEGEYADPKDMFRFGYTAAHPAPSSDAVLSEQAFEEYFCTTLSDDGSEPQSLIDACRTAAFDAWLEVTHRVRAAHPANGAQTGHQGEVT